ncbi:MAG: hypothetical protein Q3971_02470 [Moraxella sp.]|nr:hypothetical protein [Moraxella sp.]
MDYRKRFNEINQSFQQNPTQHNHTAIGEFYELKDELESLSKNGHATFDTDMVLFSVYRISGFHWLACAIYLKHHDDKANLPKIYQLTKKAKSHGNNYVLKDVRNHQQIITPQKVKLSLNDFIPSDDYDFDKTHNKEAFFINKKIAIFGRYFKSENTKIDVILPKNLLQKHLAKIQQLINHFVFMDKQTLIDYYNNPPDNDQCFTMQATNTKANDEWFALLELHSFQMSTYGDDNNPSFCVNISMGDTYDENHILNLEFDDTNLYKISY